MEFAWLILNIGLLVGLIFRRPPLALRTNVWITALVFLIGAFITDAILLTVGLTRLVDQLDSAFFSPLLIANRLCWAATLVLLGVVWRRQQQTRSLARWSFCFAGLILLVTFLFLTD